MHTDEHLHVHMLLEWVSVKIIPVTIFTKYVLLSLMPELRLNNEAFLNIWTGIGRVEFAMLTLWLTGEGRPTSKDLIFKFSHAIY